MFKKRKHILNFLQCSIIILNSLFFLVSCNNKNNKNEITNPAYIELVSIEQKSLSSDFLSATYISTKDGKEERKEEYTRFKVDDIDSYCISWTKDSSSLKNYYLDGWTYYKNSSIFADRYEYYKEENDVLRTSLTAIQKIAENDNAFLKSIAKEEYTNGNKYSLILTNYSSFFHFITNNNYSIYKSSMSFEKEAKVEIFCNNEQIMNEECTFTYSLMGKLCELNVKIVLSYEGSDSLPEEIKEKAIYNHETAELINEETDYVQSISYEEKGQKPLLATDIEDDNDERTQYYHLETSDKSEPFCAFDGTKYFVIYKKDYKTDENYRKLYVYDALSMKNLYTVIFKRELDSSFVCADGEIAVRLNFETESNSSYSKHRTTYRIYSLEDFSLLSTPKLSVITMAKDKLYEFAFKSGYGYIFSCTQVSTAHKENLYEYKTKKSMEEFTIHDEFYIDKQLDLFFLMHKTEKRLIHYIAFKLSDNSKIYEGDAEMWPNDKNDYFDNYKPYWHHEGVSFDGSSLMIEFKTGNIVARAAQYDYANHDYVIPTILKSYSSRYGRRINEKYDIVMIAIIEYIDAHTYNISDEQEWLYDKEKDEFITRINIFGGVRFYYITDDYFIFNRMQYLMVVDLRTTH